MPISFRAGAASLVLKLTTPPNWSLTDTWMRPGVAPTSGGGSGKPVTASGHCSGAAPQPACAYSSKPALSVDFIEASWAIADNDVGVVTFGHRRFCRRACIKACLGDLRVLKLLLLGLLLLLLLLFLLPQQRTTINAERWPTRGRRRRGIGGRRRRSRRDFSLADDILSQPDGEQPRGPPCTLR